MTPRRFTRFPPDRHAEIRRPHGSCPPITTNNNASISVIVLVDFDNVDPLIRGRGLTHVVDRIIQAIPVPVLDAHPRVTLRLYGGWYINNNYTQLAQRLATDIAAAYPQPFTVAGALGPTIVNVQLALSTLYEPGLPLTHTFRSRASAKGLKCDTSKLISCVAGPSCPLRHIPAFISNEECGHNGCQTTPADVLRRNEQKLVDSMIATDLLFLQDQGQAPVVLVSTDDDMVPAVRFAIAKGATVLQIHPAPNRSLAPHFRRGFTATNYTSVSLSP